MDDRKRLQTITQPIPTNITYKINLRDSIVFEAFEANELKNAWKIVTVLRKKDSLLNDCLLALNINSGGDLMEHFFDTKINAHLISDFSEVERTAHRVLSSLLPSFTKELPSNYAKFLKIFTDPRNYTVASLWAEDILVSVSH